MATIYRENRLAGDNIVDIAVCFSAFSTVKMPKRVLLPTTKK